MKELSKYSASVKKIENLFTQFNSVPFMFVGSGLSRRYLELPDWKTLITYFVEIVNPYNPYTFSSYLDKVRNTYPNYMDNELLPEMATLLEKEFNQIWYENQRVYEIGVEHLEKIASGNVTPFKAAVATFFAKNKETV